jgi:hypothetical protein
MQKSSGIREKETAAGKRAERLAFAEITRTQDLYSRACK